VQVGERAAPELDGAQSVPKAAALPERLAVPEEEQEMLMVQEEGDLENSAVVAEEAAAENSCEQTEASETSPRPSRPPRRKRSRVRKSKSTVALGALTSPSAPSSPEPPRYTDPWGGYRPHLLRRRMPWPEVCCCVAHSQPHRHEVCEVDDRAKTLAMGLALRCAIAGPGELIASEAEPEVFTPVHIAQELSRVLKALRGVASLCVRLSDMRDGLSSSSLRRALQTSEEVAIRCGHRAGGKLGQHEIDMLTIPRGVGAELSLARQRQACCAEARGVERAQAELSVLSIFSMLLEASRRCCEKDAELSASSPLEKLEWLLEALQPAPPTAALAAPSWPSLAPSGGSSRGTAGAGEGSALTSSTAQRLKRLSSFSRSPLVGRGSEEKRMPQLSGRSAAAPPH